MNKYLFSKVVGFSIATLLLTTSAHAMKERGSNGTNTAGCSQTASSCAQDCCEPAPVVCCPEPAPGPFAYAFCKDVGLACPSDFYVWGEFLYMVATEDGLEYAVSTSPCDTITNNTGFTFPLKGGVVEGFSTECKDWNWNAGFRFGAGFYVCHDCWTIQAEYTQLNINNHTSTHLNGSALLVPIWMADDAVHAGGNNLGSARWDADFSTIDFRLGKPYHVSRYLVAHPYFGIRGAWIDQCYTAEYSGFFNTSVPVMDSASPVDGASMDADNDFWGVGTRAGIDTEWYIGRGAYLYGNVSASLLYGKFDVDQTFTGGPLSTDDGVAGTLNNEISHEFFTVVPNVEMALGIAWAGKFCCDRYRVTASLGWEFHQWWDQNRMRKFQDDGSIIHNDTTAKGDLSFTGLSFKVGLDF